jgi:hypothetical protein
MGTTYDSWCSHLYAEFSQSRLKRADSNWPRQCVVRIIITCVCRSITKESTWTQQRLPYRPLGAEVGNPISRMSCLSKRDGCIEQ